MIATGEFYYVLSDGSYNKVEIAAMPPGEFDRFWSRYRRKHPLLRELNAIVELSGSEYHTKNLWLNLLIPSVDAWFSLPSIFFDESDSWVSSDGSRKNKDVSLSVSFLLYDSGRRAAQNIKACM